MSDKCNADGKPNVLYLEDALTEKWGAGSARIICPIADPFVRHHGALGSFVRVHATRKEDVDLSNLGDHRLRSHGGLSEQSVPLLMSRPAEPAQDTLNRSWRNFDIFDLLLNH